jgi:3-phenylpropionate/trans-cinnamate dioxygenase ferredoxin reductase component
MSDRIADIVMIGGGLASAKAAESLREAGYDGRLTLIAEEAHRPYERPPLSKGVLAGTVTPDTVYVHDAGFYAARDIDLLTGDAVSDIDRHAGKVTTRSGQALPFDRLLLATGARPRQLPLPERDPDGVATLRTLDDARALARRLRESGHVTVVGAGWIGCEVAAAACELGAEVTMIDPSDTPLRRVLGARIGRVFADLHLDHGVELRLGVGVVDARGDERVEQLALSDGTTVDTDFVVVGIGAVPRTELAEHAGLTVHDGIVVDATLSSSDPRIFAAGDVARAWHPRYGRHVRIEHWANALNQGEAAAANLLGAGQAYDRLPYFFSDQYDLGMEYVGHATEQQPVVFRGTPATREFIAFWLADQRVTAAMHANVWGVVDDLKALIQSAEPVDPTRLADPHVPLADVIEPVS